MEQTISQAKYEEIMERIRECIKYFEFGLEGNRYFFGLANGDSINLVIPKNHIPHLLGVHVEKLRSANIVKSDTSAYEILKKLINSDLTYMDMKTTNHNFDINSLFSEFIDSKIGVFIDNLKVRTDDVYCIVKYYSDRSYTTGQEQENSDYFIIRKRDKKFSVLGIVQGDYNRYVPVTSRLYNSYEELSEFLKKVAKNQEVTYFVTFKIENYSNEFSASGYINMNQKLEINKNLKDVASKYGAIPSTNRDFLVTIERFLNNTQKNSNTYSILNLIKESITSGNIVVKEEVKLILDDEVIPEGLELLIDAYNNLICSTNNDNKSANNSYSSMEKENSDLKKQLESLRNEVLTLKEQITGLEEQNNSLNGDVKKLKVLTDAFESIKQM